VWLHKTGATFTRRQGIKKAGITSLHILEGSSIRFPSPRRSALFLAIPALSPQSFYPLFSETKVHQIQLACVMPVLTNGEAYVKKIAPGNILTTNTIKKIRNRLCPRPKQGLQAKVIFFNFRSTVHLP
jgi:hypothetical protein